MNKLRHFPVIFAVALLAGTGLLRADEQWMTDYKKALERAKEEKKLVLLDFTGSDWCKWCKILDQEIFSQERFKLYADKKFVLVTVDFPEAKPQPVEVKKQNMELQERYNIEEYPTVLIVDPSGNVVRKVRYDPGDPDAFYLQLIRLPKS